MKKWLAIISAVLAFHAHGATVLWAALDESATIDGIAFRDYVDASSSFVNSARLSIGDAGISQSGYSMDVVVQLPL